MKITALKSHRFTSYNSFKHEIKYTVVRVQVHIIVTYVFNHTSCTKIISPYDDEPFTVRLMRLFNLILLFQLTLSTQK